MIKLSLVYFISGVTIGTMMLINKAWLISPFLWFVIPIHIEFLIFGWIIQFTLGVAYWILPRFLETKGRGNKYAAWAMLIFLNIGILLVTISNYGIGDLGWLGRGLQLMSVLLFLSLHWKRVVTYNRG